MVLAFGKQFTHLSEETAVDLRSLAQESAVYQYLFLEEDDQTPTYVRIRLQPEELVRYVAGLWGCEQYRSNIETGLPPHDALNAIDDQDVATTVRQYNAWANAQGTGTEYCQAAFIGEDLETLLCSAVPGRFEVVGAYYDHDRRHLLREIVASLPNCVTYLSRQARQGLNGLEFTSEEHVRDLLYTMLRGVFPDAIVEDPTERNAGGFKRIDIVLRNIKTLVELKFVRQSNRSEIVDQLKIDIESYHVHTAAKTLLCVIWDPDRCIHDRVPLVRDLSGKRTRNEHTYNVEVVILP